MIDITTHKKIYTDTSSISPYNADDFTEASIGRAERLNAYWGTRVIFGQELNTIHKLPLEDFIDHKLDVLKKNKAIRQREYLAYSPRQKIKRHETAYLWRNTYQEDTESIRLIAEVVNKVFLLIKKEAEQIQNKLKALDAISGILEDLTQDQQKIFQNEIKRGKFFR